MRWLRNGAIVAMLAPLPGGAASAQPAPQAAPPERIGPVWDHREHQPNPAEIEARERARGVIGETRQDGAREVDRLFRDLTGSDPAAQPQSTRMRDADRR
ncbi:hypothetical protein [Roseicella sp. DB1501]|uniref:hypothetical protein n=1 Tax=Roseicella sp. DB1501 TaxID=2730925 RepID=UPI001491BAA1|nr:hypothetical protein [Roseicella sp. DB1501]NOG69171.1 hypothetical protein [Roseicella sp. DB1501]